MRILADKRLLLLVGIVFMLFVLLNTLLTEPARLSNLDYFEGEFKGVTKEKIKGKHSYFYVFTLEPGPEDFQISADFTNCFELSAFQAEVEQGDYIRIGCAKTDGPFRKGSVASVSKEGKEFFNLECRNQDIEDSKKLIPILSLSAIVFFWWGIVWMSKTNSY